MNITVIEALEPRVQLSGIQYGVAANGDPDQTGVLATSGPGLNDLGAKAVRLFTDTSYLSSDFARLPSGKIYVRNPALVQSLSYAKKYHNAGIAVTLCIQLSTDRSMTDGSLLTDPTTGAARPLLPTELRSPKVFGTWYDTLSQAQISKTDSTSVTKVLDFWEIGNEPNHAGGSYWPSDPAQPPGFIEDEMNSYVDHDLKPAYAVLSKLHEPVIGAGLSGGTFEQYNELNNQPGARKHQYSNNCDYLNFHPYGLLGSTVDDYTPLGAVRDFTAAIYGDGTVKKPFVITEYNVFDSNHIFPLDPNPNPREAAEQVATAQDLDQAHTQFLNAPKVQLRCAWVYYYRLVADAGNQRGGLFYPPPGGTGTYTPMMPLYDLFKSWAKGAPAPAAPKTTKGVLNLGVTSAANAVAVQRNGFTLVVSDDGVRRYDTSGKLDRTYGVNGFVALPMIGKTAALQGDGELIVAGSQNDADSRLPFHMCVTRLTTSGAIDTSFATNGFFTMKSGTGSQATSIALRNGKIVIAGRKTRIVNAVLIRLNVDGQLDTTFGDGGAIVLPSLGFFSDVAIAKSGAVTALLTPYALSPQTTIVRYTNAGVLDATFGTGGMTAPQSLVGDGMFTNPDGSVLLVAHDPLSPTQVIERFTSTGALDPKFGTSGVQALQTSQTIRGNPIELSDGSRFLFGSIGSSLASDSKHIFVSRLTTSGQIDTSFGTSGFRQLSSTNVQDLPFAATVGGSNSITIVAGAFAQKDEGSMTQELLST